MKDTAPPAGPILLIPQSLAMFR